MKKFFTPAFLSILFVVLFLFSSAAHASVTTDSYAVSTAPSSATTKSWTHNISASSKLVLVYVFTESNARTVTSVTVGGVNAILQNSLNDLTGSNGGRLDLWSLANPPTGSQTVVINWNTTANGAGFSVSFLGSDGTFRNLNTTTGGTLTVNSVAGNLVSDAIMQDFGGTCANNTLTVGVNQIQGSGLRLCTDSLGSISGSTNAGASFVSMDWTGSSIAAHIGVDVNVGGTPPPPDGDTTAPTVPTNLSATAISSSQIDLSWTASADAVGVTGYKIFRNGTQVGTSPSTSYSDSSLAPSTSYTYTVSAYDLANNNSSQSSSDSATTQASSPPPTGNIFYIRDGGTSSGCTDWINACDSLPTVLQRGATYYVAVGNYSAHTFNDAENGGQLITIKKATDLDHGTGTGWNSSYGSGQAVFTAGLYFSKGYYILDGQGRADIKSGHGIKINNSSSADANKSIQIGDFDPVKVDNVTIRYVEIEGSHCQADGCVHDNGIIIRGGGNNVFIEYNSIHDVGGVNMSMRGGKNLANNSQNNLVQHNWMARNYSSPTYHSEAITVSEGFHNLSIRYNSFQDIVGTAFIATSAGSNAYNNSNWYIYGNIFSYSLNGSIGGVGNGIVSAFDQTISGNLWIFNNSVININPSARPGNLSSNMLALPGALATLGDVRIKNNLYYNSTLPTTYACFGGTATCISYTFDHTSYFNTPNNNDPDINKQSASGNPFINYSVENFHLIAGTNAGATLSTPFNVDIDGNTRNSDGVWDNGAYEFTGGSPPPPTPIPGDLNLDHIVNSLDYSLLNSKWLQNYSAYDLFVDGLINSLDYAILSSNWLKTW